MGNSAVFPLALPRPEIFAHARPETTPPCRKKAPRPSLIKEPPAGVFDKVLAFLKNGHFWAQSFFLATARARTKHVFLREQKLGPDCGVSIFSKNRVFFLKPNVWDLSFF